VTALLDLICEYRDLYVIIDQFNALELKPESDPMAEKKKQARNWLDRMKFNHLYIYSASANEQSGREYSKQNKVSIFPVFGGLTNVMPSCLR
jgi:hypothetical protein